MQKEKNYWGLLQPQKLILHLILMPRSRIPTHPKTHSNRETLRKKMRPAVTHKWKRDTGNRHDSDIHSYIDKHMGDKPDEYPIGKECFECRICNKCIRCQLIEDDPKEDKKKYSADKAPFFRKCSKDEVCLVFW